VKPAQPGAIPTLGLALLVATVFSPVAAWSAEWRWQDVQRIVAVSDVHGAYAALVRTLQNAQVIDDGLAWNGERTHLVVTGDILDRGPDSRGVMDLLMRLEGEAGEAGGRVHVLLGNHEVMNLTGDLRYVSAAEYAAFAPEEAAADRERAFQTFQAARPDAPDLQALKREFDLRAPEGFFGHRRAFLPDGYYGAWLLQKPLVIVINDTAFVHGGLSPMVAKLGLEGVNGELKTQVTRYAERLDAVIGAGLMDPTENFFRHAGLLKALPADTQRSAELQQAIDDIVSLSNADVHDSASPIWYRGNIGCSALIESDRLDAALTALGARRVVIGHTPTVSRRVLQRLGGRVVEIDTGMLNASYGGSGHALVIERNRDRTRLSVVSEAGSDATLPAPHPRPSPPEVSALAVTELERILAEGEIRSTEEDASGRTFVRLHDRGTNATALFTRNPRGRNFVPELAAYRLDRLLELDMVPVTVAREVDGDAGTLQVFAANTRDEKARSESGDGYSAWCPLAEQWNAMYVFDALSFNALRHPQSMLYSPRNWQLTLTGHSQAFAAKGGRPPWLEDVELAFGGAWTEALLALSDEVLEAELADVLDKRRLGALKKRRDALLEAAASKGRQETPARVAGPGVPRYRHQRLVGGDFPLQPSE
jgi:hypothetical protein